MVAHVHLLEHQRRGDAEESADDERANEDDGKGGDGGHDRLLVHLSAGLVEAQERAREDDRHRIVEHRLAEDHREEVNLHAKGLEDGEHSHRVGRRDERAEGERSEHGHRVAQPHLAGLPDHEADDEAGEDGAHEGEEDGRPDVVEERTDVHVVAGLEDDWRDQERHEELEVELIVLRHFLVAHRNGHGGDEHAHEHADACLGQNVDVVLLEDVAADERATEGKNANHIPPFDVGLLLCLRLRLRLRFLRLLLLRLLLLRLLLLRRLEDPLAQAHGALDLSAVTIEPSDRLAPRSQNALELCLRARRARRGRSGHGQTREGQGSKLHRHCEAEFPSVIRCVEKSEQDR